LQQVDPAPKLRKQTKGPLLQCCLFCGERAFGSLPRRVDCLPQSHLCKDKRDASHPRCVLLSSNGNFDSLSPLHSIPQLHSQLGREEFEKWKCCAYIFFNKTLPNPFKIL
jgi:hypothetical protein